MERAELESHRWRSVAGLVSVTVVTVAVLSIPFGLAAASGADAVGSTVESFLPSEPLEAPRLPELSQTSLVYDRDGTLLAELDAGITRHSLSTEEIPEEIVAAVLAAEDRRFFEHGPIDPPSVVSAAIDGALTGSVRGASTITQQVVKRAFLSTEQTIERKLAEARLATVIEERYSKTELLTHYLNDVYFGRGAYGVEAAAQAWFGSPASELAIDQAATLAVLIRNPTRYDPTADPAAATERRNRILATMVEENWISAAQADAAASEPTEVAARTADVIDDHVVAATVRVLLDLGRHEFDALGTTEAARTHAIFGCGADQADCEGGGGLRIELTLDEDAQRTATGLLASTLPSAPGCSLSSAGCPPTGALVSIEDGAIVAMAGGLPFSESEFDLVWQAQRSSGSVWPRSTDDGVSPLQVAEAWSGSPAGLVERIVDAAGNVVYERPRADGAPTGMHETATEATATDAWFVSTSPQRTTVVWIGHMDGRPALDGTEADATAQELARRFERAVPITPPRR